MRLVGAGVKRRRAAALQMWPDWSCLYVGTMARMAGRQKKWWGVDGCADVRGASG